MATLMNWFTAKWMPQIHGQMDAPNAYPTLNVLSFSCTTCRGFSELLVEVTLHDIEHSPLTIWFPATWMP